LLEPLEAELAIELSRKDLRTPQEDSSRLSYRVRALC